MPSKETLTKNQEAFVQALLKGKTQRQAFYEAYPNSKKWMDKSVDSKASVLFQNVKVRKRFNELNNKIENKIIYDTKQLREFWTKILLDSESSMQSKLKASELLGKSQGSFIEKRETTFTSADCVIEVVKHED